MQTRRTVYKSVQAWMYELSFEGSYTSYTPEKFTVNYPRAIQVSKRLERAVNMNVTAQLASTSYQVRKGKAASGHVLNS